MKLSYLVSKLIKKIQIPAIKNSVIDKTSKVCSGSLIVQTNIRRYSYVGNFCTVINVDIGSFCSIADNCIIGGASHPINWASTSPVFHKGGNILKKNFSKHEYIAIKKTIIGNDVWIGSNCLIKSGVRIGDGAVIGMGSVVTKDVGSFETWGGNPARIIKTRFNEEIVTALKKYKWWEWENKKIELLADYFTDVNILVKKFEEVV